MPIDFFKEGKGVQPNERERSPFARFFMLYALRFWKLIALNALYVLLCLPVVTAAPATVALSDVLRRFSQNKLAYVWTDFFNAFRANFKKAFAFGLINALMLCVSGAAAYFYFLNALAAPAYFLPFGAALSAFALSVFAGFHGTLLIGAVELPLGSVLKNALRLSVAALWRNLLALAVCALVTWLIALLFPASLLLVLLLAPVSCWYAVVFICWPQTERFCVNKTERC